MLNLFTCLEYIERLHQIIMNAVSTQCFRSLSPAAVPVALSNDEVYSRHIAVPTPRVLSYLSPSSPGNTVLDDRNRAYIGPVTSVRIVVEQLLVTFKCKLRCAIYLLPHFQLAYKYGPLLLVD